ncbi:MAG: tetratricopeptide repeat protein, partial [Anaerolineae bacterium]|nr:tetratricopeptide repeat protein [Anaerolineae bacterium]
VRTVGEQRLTCYRFSHTLLQQYLYNKLGKGQRIMLHREIARILEALYEGSRGEIAAQLAFHYAGDLERERYYARLAGERAETLYAQGESVRYLSRALELTPESNHAERYALLLTRERAHHHLGNRDLQHQDLATLHELARILADDGFRAEVALRKSDYARVTGDYVAAADAARIAVELARSQESGHLNQATYCESAGHLRWGKALLRQGDYQAARARLEQALTLAAARPGIYGNSPGPTQVAEDHSRSTAEPIEGTGRRWLQLKASSHRCLGVVCWHLGDNAGAKSHYRQALRICRQTEDRRCQATAINGLGVIAWSEKSPAEAWANFEQAFRLHDEIGDRRGQCRTLSNLGDVAIYWGDYTEARRLFARCLPLCREISEPWIESGVLNNLGIIADRLGAYTEALTRLQQALDLRRKIGDRQGEAEGLSDLGLAYHHVGDNESSRSCSEQSLCIMRD